MESPRSEPLVPIFDEDSVLEIVDQDREFLYELIGVFLAELPRHRDLLRSGIVSADPHIVRRACHQLKASVGNLGGRRALQLIAELEEIARSQKLDELQTCFPSCESELNVFEQALRDYLRDR